MPKRSSRATGAAWVVVSSSAASAMSAATRRRKLWMPSSLVSGGQLEPNAPAVRLDQRARDRQPDATARRHVQPGDGRPTVELLPDARLLLARDARPLV